MTRQWWFAVGLSVTSLACAEPEPAPADGGGQAVASDESNRAAVVSTVLINPNMASSGELQAVPGVSAAIASTIEAGRPFLDMTEVDALLSDLDESTRTTLYGAMFVPLNLNSATAAEIGLIPGVGPRMTHEFEEYRPYVSMSQFRREMGKYVDDAEVARLSRYVFVPIELNTASDDEILAIPGVGPRLLREFKEYRPYTSLEQFRREIGKYVDDRELERLAKYVRLDF